jgi:hypothetical protein
MGHTISTLDNWWSNCESSKLLIEGPQVAFNLKRGDKTILLFGECHKTVDRKCSNTDAEQPFIELFNSLIAQENCINTDIIIEVTNSHLEYIKNAFIDYNDRIAKLDMLAFSYYNKYLFTEQCKIELLWANPSKLNIISSKIKTCYENLTLLSSEDEKNKCKTQIRNNTFVMFEILKSFINKTDVIHTLLYFIIDNRDKSILFNFYFKSLYEIINKFINKFEHLQDNYDINNVEIMKELTVIVYQLSLDMIDLCTIIRILAGKSNDIIVYEGTIHIFAIVSYLMKFADYKLTGVSHTIIDTSNINEGNEIHCMYLTNDIKKGLQSIKNTDIINESNSKKRYDIIEQIANSY